MGFLLSISAAFFPIFIFCRDLITLCMVWSIKFYRYFISPLKPRCCIYEQSCSEYALEVLRSYPLPKALISIVLRLLSCHPFKKNY